MALATLTLGERVRTENGEIDGPVDQFDVPDMGIGKGC